VIYADELVYVDKVGDEGQKRRLKDALKDKMVMYGLSLEGLHDNVDTPVHGLLPGVFFHAMTLDNLMHYGSDYVHATDEGIEQVNQYIWLAMTLVFSLLLFHYDRKQYRFTSSCDRWVNYENAGEEISAFRLFWLASLTIITISIGMFLFVRYEPFNSIGFLVLIGVSSGLVSSNFAEKIIRFLTFSWLKDLMPWLRGVPSRLTADDTEDKKMFGSEAASEFYQRTFELTMDDGWMKACNQDSDISPRVYVDPESGACAPIPDLSVEVDDIDTVWSRIKSTGYEIRYDLSTEPCGIRRFCFCDPQQKLVNVFQRGDELE
jgi:predicted enzyme related to lactoylglutathione lyase